MSSANKSKAGNVVAFIPAGKIPCYVTGELRKDTPEENGRQRWARSLIDEYGYDRVDIALEFKIKMGDARKRAGLVIFKPGAVHEQENILIIVEAKRSGVPPRSRREGVEQFKSYMAACMACRYGLWVGSEKLVYEKRVEGTFEAVDLPFQGDTEPRVLAFKDLVPAVVLNATLRRCHNYIYVNQGLQKAEAFHEVLKLIFCKVYDETESSGQLRFSIRNEERRSEAGQPLRAGSRGVKRTRKAASQPHQSAGDAGSERTGKSCSIGYRCRGAS